ncbi:hypothetical protein DPMN_155143 [Dreissena polymorpha]|uniref:Uncharacterized protein n=1 Tax=Dreissena polymorpha TaxID=45954 RepID=A0A9D4FR98_DREPO|nr:hypothetical protein DPMN_155143 [Dreissena polymorpha]
MCGCGYCRYCSIYCRYCSCGVVLSDDRTNNASQFRRGFKLHLLPDAVGIKAGEQDSREIICEKGDSVSYLRWCEGVGVVVIWLGLGLRLVLGPKPNPNPTPNPNP